jgi:hypothetical protein
MFDAFWNDDHLSWVQLDRLISKAHHHGAFQNDEGLVGVSVTVPHEVTLEPHDLDLVVVHLGDNAHRIVTGLKLPELLGEVDLFCFHFISFGQNNNYTVRIIRQTQTASFYIRICRDFLTIYVIFHIKRLATQPKLSMPR